MFIFCWTIAIQWAEGNRPRFDFGEVKKRWALLRAMVGQGPMTIRGLAREVGRDVKAVHGDVHALLDAGLVDRTAEGRVVFPYDAVHVDFELKAA